jgi:hypothetical protein
MPAETLHFDTNIGQPNIWHSLPYTSLWGICCPVDAHAQHYQIYDHLMLVPQLKVSHQQSAELISKLIQPISVLILAQLKWKVVPVSKVYFQFT